MFSINLKNLVGKEQAPSWFSIPWLTVECYLYRRIFEAFRLISGAGRGKQGRVVASPMLKKMALVILPKFDEKTGGS